MSFPRYPVYKDSGVEWLGEVPAHWAVERLKWLFRLEKRPPREADGIVTAFRDGEVTLRSNRRTEGFTNALLEVGYQGVRTGDLVIHAMDAFAGAIGVSDSDGKATPVYSVCTPAVDGAEARYYGLLLRNMAISGFVSSLAKGVRERSTEFRWTDARDVLLPAPPPGEQTAIAAFLDRETLKIDALVAEQEKLIALLQEKRQAVISHAVTKGLDPNVPMKDSGVEWLGEVPAHWGVAPLMWLTEPGRPIMYGIVLPGPDVGEGVPILKGGNVRPERLRRDLLARTTPEIEAPYARARLRSRDLVYSIRGTIGDCEVVPEELDGCNITQDVARISPAEGIDAEWLRFTLLSEAVAEDLACGSLGAAVRGVNIYDLKRARIPVPPEDERGSIARRLAEVVGDIDRLVEGASEAITLLKERRAALISAAVTGQIDVRSAVAEAA